jgi:acylphosphatase
MHRLHAMVHGRVQGVGFRYFVMREARALKLTGWVRNHPDGSVEVEAEGPRDPLNALLERLRQGPVGARVADVAEAWSEGEGIHRGFDVKI